MLDTIAANVLVPVAFFGLLIAVPLWRILRGAARNDRRPDDPPAAPDPLLLWIRTASILSGFGPFWYADGLRPRAGAAADDLDTKEGDLT